ncbi:MAG: cell envelope integrity protein CreD, partial [Candidatus Adiutrix sp.]|nr:cell envelope integrity protein CreD [Candidatus Adiutrix sp.]
MRGEWLWLLTAMFVVLALCVALSLLIWRLWRKITLPEGAPPPRWTDLSALKTRVVQTPLVLRLIATAALALLMSAPVNMIQDLVSARTDSYREVVRELSHSWGGRQLLIGPILSVPYTIKYVVTEEAPLTASEKAELALRGEPLRAAKTISREIATEKTAIVLPEELNIAGVLDPETRKRNIYSLLVYTADLKLSGFFRKPDFKSLDDRTSAVHWDRARLLVSLTDTKAFRGISQLSLGGRAYKFVPGTGKSPAAPTGFSAEVDLDGAADVPFSFNMAIGGSQGFYVAPVAVVSRMDLSSSWPHPKFSGMGLPISREAGPTGFTAGWNVPNLVRNYPQLAALEALSPDGAAKKGQEYGYDEYESRPAAGDLPLAEYVVGVDLFEPVFHYSLITRAVKYAM